MKNKLMKLLPVIPILILAVLCLTACGSSVNTEAAATPAPEFTYASETLLTVTSSKQNALAAEPAVITDSGYYAIGGKFFRGTVPEGAREEYEGQFDGHVPCLSFVMQDGTIKELSAYSPIEADNGMEEMRDYRSSNSIEALCLRPDGNLLLVENVYTSWCDADSEIKYGSEEYYEHLMSENNWWIRVLNPDGSDISRAKIDMTEEESESSYGFYICQCDLKGNLLCSQDDRLVAYNDKGGKAYTIEINGYVYSLVTLRDGRTAALVYDTNVHEMSVRIVDAENGVFEDKAYKTDVDVYNMIDGGGDYDAYFNMGSSCFGYDLESGTSTKLFSWVNCDLISDNLNKISVQPDGTILAFTSEYDEKDEINTTELVAVKKVPYDPANTKKTLTLATLFAKNNMQDAVINFNRRHDDIRINIVDYSEYNTADDYSAGYTKLMTEIAAGNMPDLIEISEDLPYYRLASHGILEDLYPYIDADEGLKRSDFFENVFGALEVNGGLYTAMPGFAVYTAVGAASVVGEEPGITYQEYADALASLPEGCEGFDVGIDRDQLLTICTALELENLVNWSTGECNFDSEKFLKILKFANTFPKFNDEEYELSPEDSAPVRIAEGRQMLMLTILSSVEYMMDDYDALFGGDATLVGFPTDEGVGNMLYSMESMSMTSSCSDKDAAWEFVRCFLMEDYQEKAYNLPTNKKVFEEQLADAMKVEYETDANGNFKLDENGQRIQKAYGSYSDGFRTVKIYALNESQAEMLREGIANTTRMLNFDMSINDIVTEGAQAYFAGQKSAEECAKLIQSKINIYVNEQK